MLLVHTGWASCQTFEVLASPVPEFEASAATAVSADGQWVAGRISLDGSALAVVWDGAGFPVVYADLPGDLDVAEARGISDLGSTVVGTGYGSNGREAVLWLDSATPIGLGDIPGPSFCSEALAISGDGRVIVGTGRGTDFMEQAVQWIDGGPPINLGGLPANAPQLSQALAVNADGSIVVGFSNTEDAGLGRQPVAWLDGQQARAVIEPPFTPTEGNATGVASGLWNYIAGNADNQIFLAEFGDGPDFEGLGIPTYLPLPNGALEPRDAFPCNGGWRVVGDVLGPPGTNVGFIWEPSTGTRFLGDALLSDFGIDPGPDAILRVNAISADCTTVVGLVGDAGGNNRAFRLKLPPPCYADTNFDGMVTPADFIAWIAAFNDREFACDQNQDGRCDPADFTGWILNFNAGC